MIREGNTIRILDIPDKELYDINEPKVGWIFEPMSRRIGVVLTKVKHSDYVKCLIEFKDKRRPHKFWVVEECLELYDDKELKLI